MFSRHAIQFGQILIDHHLLAANQIDATFDQLDGDCETTDCEFLCVRYARTLPAEQLLFNLCYLRNLWRNRFLLSKSVQIIFGPHVDVPVS